MFKNIYYKDIDTALVNGSLCVLEVPYNHYHSEHVLAYYKDGNFYDAYSLEDPDVVNEDYINITDIAISYLNTGKNVFKKQQILN